MRDGKIGVSAVLLIAPALAIAYAGKTTAADDPAKAAVRKVLDTQVEAWNKKDLDGFCEGYWNSPDLVFQSGGTRTDGFEGMRDRYRKRYQGEGKAMGTLSFDDVEVVLLGDDASMARGRWTLAMPDESKPTGLFTLILRKFPEGWRIVHDHTSVAT